eukprot:4051339-Prymnesium_polylepis.2
MALLCTQPLVQWRRVNICCRVLHVVHDDKLHQVTVIKAVCCAVIVQVDGAASLTPGRRARAVLEAHRAVLVLQLWVVVLSDHVKHAFDGVAVVFMRRTADECGWLERRCTAIMRGQSQAQQRDGQCEGHGPTGNRTRPPGGLLTSCARPRMGTQATFRKTLSVFIVSGYVPQ